MAPSLTAALFQLQPALGEPARNLATLEKKVQAAKADLCVFPELYLTGYFNRDLLRGLAEPMDGPMVARLRAVARRTGSHIVAGMPTVGERRGVVHNSSVLVTPEGEAHRYDKVYLPSFSVFEEDLWFGEGHALPTFKTSLGRLGMCICYDLFFPEVTKAMAMQGADLLTCISASPTISREYFERVMPARAIETTSFLLFTNLTGPQDTVAFWGGAKAYGPRGDLLAEGPRMREAVTKARLDVEEVAVARAKRPVLRDSRPGLLGPGPDAEPGMPRLLAVLEAVHGHLDGWAAVGLRMGQAARLALKEEGRRPAAVEAEVVLPLKQPFACALDGLQVGAGCSLGQGNLRFMDGADFAGRFRVQGRAVVVRMRPGAVKALGQPEQEGREGAYWALAQPLETLFEVALAR